MCTATLALVESWFDRVETSFDHVEPLLDLRVQIGFAAEKDDEGEHVEEHVPLYAVASGTHHPIVKRRVCCMVASAMMSRAATTSSNENSSPSGT